MSDQPNELRSVPGLAIRFNIHKKTGDLSIQTLTLFGEVVEMQVTRDNVREALRLADVAWEQILSDARDDADAQQREIDELNSLIYNDGNYDMK